MKLIIKFSKKFNQNVSINDYGQILLNLYAATKLRILNGRTRGDLQGHISCIEQK